MPPDNAPSPGAADDSARRTIIPEPISPRVMTPPGLEPARTPSSAPLHADARVAVADLITRRVLRGVVALAIAWLTIRGDATGHPVSGITVAVLGALGMGINAAVEAAKKRPGVTAAGGAGLAVLALGGTALDLPDAGSIAALGAAAVTALVDHARGA